MAKKRKPVHPGETLREEFMAPLGLSMYKRVLIEDICDLSAGKTSDGLFGLDPTTLG
jgi:hypothetical protein